MAEFDLNAAFIPALHKPPNELPITKHRESLLYAIETYPATIIVGQTGCGKTTQIPQFLEKGGWCSGGKMIAVTQPRRIAAITVALRVAEEFGCEIGKEVGYSVRFEDATSASTRIKFLTDGLLVREAMSDRLLSRYSVVVVDEAHERSVSTDVLLALLKQIQIRRPDLRIVVSSATIQAEDFHAYFRDISEEEKDAKEMGGDEKRSIIISLDGRTHPIETLCLDEPVEDYVDKAVDTVFEIHAKEDDGDILVFMSGRDEIESALQAVADRHAGIVSRGKTLMPLPLYAGLTTEQQMFIFDKTPENMRKVVFSTNIAEASVTIEGIVYVVDCGFVKLRVYNPLTGIESLSKIPASKASAAQRAGRAGRTRPGKCFRLYPEDSFRSLPDTSPPELQRSNLAPVVLQLMAFGVENVARFDYLSNPPSKLLGQALESLHALGAIDEDAKLTRPLGSNMAELALDPMMSKTLLSARDFGCVSEVLTIAAMTSLGGNVWFCKDGEQKLMEKARARFAAREGDHLTLYNAYHAFVTTGKQEAKFCHQHHLNFKSMTRAVSIRNQLKGHLRRLNIRVDDAFPPGGGQRDLSNKAEQVRRCLTTGYFAHAAKMQPDGTFRNVGENMTFHAHPNSLMFRLKADWVIYHEAVETGDKIYIRDVTAIERDWLVQCAPHVYRIERPGLGV